VSGGPCRINTTRAAYNDARPPPTPPPRAGPPPPQRSRECWCAPSGIPGRRRRHGASRRPAAGSRKQPWRKLSGTTARTDNRARGWTVARAHTHPHTSHTHTRAHTYTPARVIIRTRVRTRFFLFFRSFLFHIYCRCSAAASLFRPLGRARSLSRSLVPSSSPSLAHHRPQSARRARRTLHRV